MTKEWEKGGLSTWSGWFKRDVIVEIVVEGIVVTGIIGCLVDEDVEERLFVGLPDGVVE